MDSVVSLIAFERGAETGRVFVMDFSLAGAMPRGVSFEMGPVSEEITEIPPIERKR